MKKYAWEALRYFGLAGWVAAGLRKSYLRSGGWLRSYDSQRAIDAEGNAIPWFTYAAIHLLAQRVQPTHRVFEWGAGQSSAWFAARVARVVSVDHDEAWAAQVRARAGANQAVLHAANADEYVRLYTELQEEFDVVVIDGIARVACCLAATQHLSTQGVVVVDNSEREEYQQGLAALTQQGFRRLDFFGLAPATLLGTCTTFFYRPENCLGI